MTTSIGQETRGGTYVGDRNGYRIIVARVHNEQNVTTWSNGKDWCAALSLNGYSDWSMPTKEELALMDPFSDLLGLAGHNFWSSTEASADDAWGQVFYSGYPGVQSYRNKTRTYCVRAVRRERI